MTAIRFEPSILPHLKKIGTFFEVWRTGTLEERQDLYAWLINITGIFNQESMLNRIIDRYAPMAKSVEDLIETLKAHHHAVNEEVVNYVILSAMVTLAEHWSETLRALVKAFYHVGKDLAAAAPSTQPHVAPSALMKLGQYQQIMATCEYLLACCKYYKDDRTQRNAGYRKKMRAAGKEIPLLLPPAPIPNRLVLPDDIRSWEDWQVIFRLLKTDDARNLAFEEYKMTLISALAAAKTPYNEIIPFLPDAVISDGWVKTYMVTHIYPRPNDRSPHSKKVRYQVELDRNMALDILFERYTNPSDGCYHYQTLLPDFQVASELLKEATPIEKADDIFYHHDVTHNRFVVIHPLMADTETISRTESAMTKAIKTTLNHPKSNIIHICLDNTGELNIKDDTETVMISKGAVRQRLAMIVRSVQYLRTSSTPFGASQLQTYLFSSHLVKRINTTDSVPALRELLKDDTHELLRLYPHLKPSPWLKELSSGRKIYAHRERTQCDYLGWWNSWGFFGYSAGEKKKAIEHFLNHPHAELKPAAQEGELSTIITGYRKEHPAPSEDHIELGPLLGLR